jgi:hypothetical protein
MKPFQKFLIINIFLSISLFLIIFFKFLGVSSGDMAIIAFTIITHIILILINIFVFKIAVKIKFYLTIAIITLLVFEIILFVNFGYYLNDVLRR